MATTLDITLSSGMQSTLTTSGGGGGVYAYAVYFDSSGSNPTWTALAEDSILKTTGGKASMTLPTTFNGGKVYFLVQSVGSDEISTDKTIKDVISTESQINYGSSETYDYRFDSFEVSLLGTSSDAGNLTSVTNFGIPMEVSIGYDDGTTDTRGYTSTGSDIFTSLKGISSTDTVVYTYSTGPLAGTSRIGALAGGAAFCGRRGSGLALQVLRLDRLSGGASVGRRHRRHRLLQRRAGCRPELAQCRLLLL